MRRRLLALLLAVVAAPLAAAGQARHGSGDLEVTDDEAVAWEHVLLERYVAARETAEAVVRDRPSSVVGHAVLGFAQRYGEGNLPRALYHLRTARRLLEARAGPAPSSPAAVQWHARILRESAHTCGEMERYEEELELWDRLDALYQPPNPGERIWPLMMLRRFGEARDWAGRALAEGDIWSRRQALNGLCAVENEAGNRLASYAWCTAHAREVGREPTGSVYLCNAGEAARGVFRLDEAERLYLDATEREVAWYANPWMNLADLYLRAGRIAQAAAAVRSMHEYGRARPPHTQQQDASERTRAVAALLVVAGRPDRALPLTERSVRYPDRRGGQSRSPEADLATAALLHRRALLDAAEVELEGSSVQGPFGRLAGRLRASWLRLRAFRAGRQVVALAEDGDLLRGLLEAEGRIAQGTPPWLAAELVEVVGPGPVEAALAQARVGAEVPGLLAYLDAYEAEAAAAGSDWARAEQVAARAAAALPPGEALLRARVELVRARAAEAEGRTGEAVVRYVEVLQVDAPLLRRTRGRLPVSLESGTTELARRTARLLRRSPRLRRSRSPLTLRLESDGEVCRACLVVRGGGEVDCAAEPAEGPLDEAARRCASAVHERLLGARVDMSLLDASALEGSTTRGGSVDDLLGGTISP